MPKSFLHLFIYQCVFHNTSLATIFQNRLKKHCKYSLFFRCLSNGCVALHCDFIQGAQNNVLRQSCKKEDPQFRYQIITIEMVLIKTQLTSEYANGAAQQSGTEAAVSGPRQTHTHPLLQRLAPDKQDKA